MGSAAPVRNPLPILLLVLVTFLWGTTFVVVKDLVAELPPMLLVAMRCGVASLVLLPVGLSRGLLLPGLVLGLLQFVGFATQTVGLQWTTASRGAFITGLAVVLVPCALALRGRSVGRALWLASLLCVAGLALLCWDSSPPNIGDLWVLGCAFAWASFLLALGHYARPDWTTLDTLRLSLVQVGVIALCAGLASVPSWPLALDLSARTWLALLYLGVLATAVTTWLQLVALRRVDPPTAAVVFSLEPVFAALLAWPLLGETLGTQGLLGGALVVAAMILATRGSEPKGGEGIPSREFP